MSKHLTIAAVAISFFAFNSGSEATDVNVMKVSQSQTAYNICEPFRKCCEKTFCKTNNKPSDKKKDDPCLDICHLARNLCMDLVPDENGF